MSKSDKQNLSTNNPHEFQPFNAVNNKIYFNFRRLLIKLLKPTEFVILEALSLRANHENDGWCWPTQQTIAEDTGITSPTTIISAVNRLKELGILEVARRKTLVYRPVNPSRELVAKLTSIAGISSPESEIRGKGRVVETVISNFQNLEASNIVETGTLDFQNLEELVSETGTSQFQILDTNESKGIESNLMHQKECNEVAVARKAAPSTVKSGAATPVTANVDKIDINRLKEAYRKAQSGQGPNRHRKEDTADVINTAFRFAFDYPPDTGRLLKMTRLQPVGGGWSLIETILSLAGKKVWGNPHDYLQKVITNKQLKPERERKEYGTRQSGWNYDGHRQSNRADRTAEEIRREFETFRLPGS